MTRAIATALIAITLAPLGAQPAAQCKPDRLFDQIYAAYSAGDVQAISKSVKKEAEFDRVRLALCFAGKNQWLTDRHPIQLVFTLDLAEYGLKSNWKYWLDVLDEGRKFVVSRPDLPGRNNREDDIELLWHKTAMALLAGTRRPDLLLMHGLRPLSDRIAPAPSGGVPPRLVDPWIELLAGFAQEQQTLLNPGSLDVNGASAIRHYDEAAKYETTRAEAFVRKSFLLTRMRRPQDALVALDAFGDRTADRTVLGYSRLSRARALEALDRLDEAATAYEDALALAPGAQSALVGLAALELSRGRLEASVGWADQIRKATEVAYDPWWQYAFGDRRFYESRLQRLRGLQ